jgi:hypothetical protein
MKKNKYDTAVVLLYLLGQEPLIPKESRKKIPYSTVTTWRKMKYENYEGNEFLFLFDDSWDLIRLKQENIKIKSTLRAIVKCYLLLSGQAIHKIMKGRYIKNRGFESLEGLATFLNEAVKNYNYQKATLQAFSKDSG